MKKNNKIAAIILNRNLPVATNNLYENIKKNNKVDIFVVEAGSDKNKLSKYCTWYADWPEAKKNGLRFSRGMNYALYKMFKNGSLYKYDYVLLLTNDIEFKTKKFDKIFSRIFKNHPRLGILSPLSENYGEGRILNRKKKLKYFWYVENYALVLRKEYIMDMVLKDTKNYLNFLFDGSNFRGYGSQSEICAKSYLNFWSVGITNEVKVKENEMYLKNFHKQIKTEDYSLNLKLYVKEGKNWMKKKYGFDNKWSMHMYSKMFYDKFFEYYPEYITYKV